MLPHLDPLVAALGGGETTRLIGGVVRDTLLGAPVSDIDMATRLTPDDVMARLKKIGRASCRERVYSSV